MYLLYILCISSVINSGQVAVFDWVYNALIGLECRFIRKMGAFYLEDVGVLFGR